MIINVNKITEKGYALNDSTEIDNAQLLEEGSYFLQPVAFEVNFKRQEQRIQARGSVRTSVSLNCVRCLEPFAFAIHSSFDVVLFPKNMVEGRSAALEDDELEYIFFENDQVDLEKLLVEQVNLFVPFKPVCHPECKGICPGCGANLNHGACPCDGGKNEIKFLFQKAKR